MSPPTTLSMSPAASDVLQRALSLEPEERAKVVEKLIESLDATEPMSPEEFQAVWGDELERRAQAVEDSTVELRDAFEVLEGLKKSLAARKQP